MAAKRTGRLAKPSAAVPTRDLAESLESAVFGAVKDTLAPVLQSLQPGPSKNSTHRRKGDSRKRRYFYSTLTCNYFNFKDIWDLCVGDINYPAFFLINVSTRNPCLFGQVVAESFHL